MYHIGICDDDLAFIEYMKRLFGIVCTDIRFYEYLSGEELIKDMQTREKYDLLILDVVMPGMDGNETAKEFRKQFPDTLLVFCSGVSLPTVESFETTPYRYWLKEYTEDRMIREVNEILDKLKKTHAMPYIIGKRENQMVKLSLDSVLYIAIAKRGSVIYCKNSKEIYTSRKKLTKFYEQLKDFGFIYAHNSYIVNLKNVAIAGTTELEFVNGVKLSVSRNRAKEFIKAFAADLSYKY